jgi:quercetin dioxygenase-like cupin family protein
MYRTAALILLIAAAPATATEPSPPVPAETRVDVPEGLGPQQAVVLTREIPVGGASGWHRHPGIEIGQVLSGVTELRTLQESRRYAAGETFVVPRGVVHNGVNVGEVPSWIAITYLVDMGAALRSDAPDPHRSH